MSAREMQEHLGKEGVLTIGALQIRVTVEDVRKVYNRIDFLVAPVAGGGTDWVDAHRVVS